MIEVKHLMKSFGNQTVLDNLTLTICANDIYGLLGPNGAGKSTTINILCSLLDADAGTVAIHGKPISEKTKHNIGIVPQEISVYQDMTCKENLQFFARIYGLRGPAATNQVNKILHSLNLKKYQNTKICCLSGGWQQRVNIAAALVHSPSLLILDEPTAGLDIDARFELWDLIQQLRKDGVTVLLTTHILEEAERLCSRIGIIQNGKIAGEGSLNELRKLVPAKQVALIETTDLKQLENKLSSFDWKFRQTGSRILVYLPEKQRLNDIVKNFEDSHLISVSLHEIGLEHVYLEITRNHSGI